MPKWSSAWASFNPPRETQGWSWPRNSSGASSRQQIARLLDAPLAAEDLAGQDHRRCPAAALDEAALDQQQVGALLHGGRRLTWRWKRKVSKIAVAARPRARPSQRPTAPTAEGEAQLRPRR